MFRAPLTLILLSVLVGATSALQAAGSTSAPPAKAPMIEDWDFYPLRVDDAPASIYLNLALAHAAPISTQPNMAYIRVRMRRPKEDGLSSDEEFEALSKLEDSLIDGVARKGRSTFVGRNTSGGLRDFYFYTADPKAFAISVKMAMAQWPEYHFEIGGRLDAKWSVYFDFLYPSADDFQRILNRRVTDGLVAEGDDLSKPRTIDHMAYMPSVRAAEDLRDTLRKQGFVVHEPKAEGASIALNFERTDRPDRIDDVEIPIARRVRDLGGDYDGWGCEVTK